MNNPLAPPGPPARCTSEAEHRALIERAFTLGVPRDYARRHCLRQVREPVRLASIGMDIQQREQWLTPAAARAFLAMRKAAAHDNVELQIVSAFRSIAYQLGIIERKLQRGLQMDAILRVSAAPGYSEHHSGRALDLTAPGYAPVEEVFEQSAAFAWLTRKAPRFGFALSYPRGNRHGIAYEPWHWCWHARLARQNAPL
ncbi:MAG TPA: M15 family metallopeptidase [Rhodanobacteraceae bacterium]|nr:M15 family metallopeptidase [Rhodanobacteraceae bacterium]